MDNEGTRELGRKESRFEEKRQGFRKWRRSKTGQRANRTQLAQNPLTRVPACIKLQGGEKLEKEEREICSKPTNWTTCSVRFHMERQQGRGYDLTTLSFPRLMGELPIETQYFHLGLNDPRPWMRSGKNPARQVGGNVIKRNSLVFGKRRGVNWKPLYGGFSHSAGIMNGNKKYRGEKANIGATYEIRPYQGQRFKRGQRASLPSYEQHLKKEAWKLIGEGWRLPEQKGNRVFLRGIEPGVLALRGRGGTGAKKKIARKKKEWGRDFQRKIVPFRPQTQAWKRITQTKKGGEKIHADVVQAGERAHDEGKIGGEKEEGLKFVAIVWQIHIIEWSSNYLQSEDPWEEGEGKNMRVTWRYDRGLKHDSKKVLSLSGEKDLLVDTMCTMLHLEHL